MLPLISIITVVKDPTDEFMQTIESVAEQDSGRFEWIVKCCGRLPSHFREVIQEKGAHATIIEREDSGIYDGMNQGLFLAAGEYVFFLNSGDVFFGPGIVRKVSEHIDATKAALVYGAYEIEGEIVTYPKSLSSFFFLRTALCHQSYFISKAILFESGGFSSDFKVLADHEILLRNLSCILLDHSRSDILIASLPKMGFSNRQRVLKRIERRRLMEMYYPWNRYFSARSFHLLSLPTVRKQLQKVSAFRYVRRRILRLLYRSSYLG